MVQENKRTCKGCGGSGSCTVYWDGFWHYRCFVTAKKRKPGDR